MAQQVKDPALALQQFGYCCDLSLTPDWEIPCAVGTAKKKKKKNLGRPVGVAFEQLLTVLLPVGCFSLVQLCFLCIPFLQMSVIWATLKFKKKKVKGRGRKRISHRN